MRTSVWPLFFLLFMYDLANLLPFFLEFAKRVSAVDFTLGRGRREAFESVEPFRGRKPTHCIYSGSTPLPSLLSTFKKITLHFSNPLRFEESWNPDISMLGEGI